MVGNTSRLTIIIANTSKRTSEMSNARFPVVDPTAFTENEILNGTSLAVTRTPERNVDCISADFQDANLPRPDSQEKTIVKDTCDSVIILRSKRQEDYAKAQLALWTKIHRGMIWTGHTSLAREYLTLIQDILILRKISATNWSDRCSLKWRLYNSEHSHGSCGFSEPSVLFSISGVQPRKLRVKDWRNAHGKVGIIGCHLFTYSPRKRRKQHRQHRNICSSRQHASCASFTCRRRLHNTPAGK